MDRHIVFERLHNVRDLGGYRGHGGGTVRWGALYRADSLGKLAGADLARFRALGVRTVLDLRYPWEVEARGRVPADEGLTYRNLSIEHRPYDQAAIDPTVDPWRFLADRYAEVAADGAVELRQALTALADDPGPVALHCASGKDRTGIVAALALTVLGVSEADVLADFALTERATDRLVADWHAANPGRTLRWPGYGRAPATVLRLFLTDLAGTYGSVDAYLRDVVGVDTALTDRLRARYLVP